MTNSNKLFFLTILTYLHGYENDPDICDEKICMLFATIHMVKTGQTPYGYDPESTEVLRSVPEAQIKNFLEGYKNATRKKYDKKTGQRKMKEYLTRILAKETGITEEELLHECTKADCVASMMTHGIHIDTTNDTGGETNG